MFRTEFTDVNTFAEWLASFYDWETLQLHDDESVVVSWDEATIADMMELNSTIENFGYDLTLIEGCEFARLTFS